ncbi:hypothetical protein AD940_03100 [Gluconobacter thailandicus]|nr:hypothetical protein AD940_03100 [Gluconobacter thailandicus]
MMVAARQRSKKKRRSGICRNKRMAARSQPLNLPNMIWMLLRVIFSLIIFDQFSTGSLCWNAEFDPFFLYAIPESVDVTTPATQETFVNYNSANSSQRADRPLLVKSVQKGCVQNKSASNA